MTPEKVIEFAKQIVCYDKHDKLFWGDSEQIQAFAQLVRNGTLEEAVLKCEQEKEHWFSYVAAQDACADCAKEIRNLKS